MVYGIWYINCNIDEFATNVHKIKNGKMLTNRNCRNIQYGPDFAKTFLGQQCCHAVKVFLTLETEEEKEEKGGIVQQSTNRDVQVGPGSLWV